MTSARASFAYCERVARREAGNFYPAFCLLPPRQRQAMCALYTFLRLCDDVTDGPGSVEEKRRLLDGWRQRFALALAGRFSHPCHAALQHILQAYAIPREYLDAALDGVGMDLGDVHVETFAELYRYCYHVASVVGLACIHIWGFSDPRAKEYAEQAGIAFQLTNILRDLREDASRQRVYLPREELERFGYRPEQLERGERDDHFRALMRFQVERARGYYDRSRALLQFLPPAGRAVFQVMSRTYRGLLDAIESRNYDVFTSRVRVSRWKKVGFALEALPVRFGVIPREPCRVSGRVESQLGRLRGTAHHSPLLIIGGGLAGLAAAAALAPRGFQVTLLEARGRLGGRASSFHDPVGGQLVDTCQHVSMGCCTNLAHFCRTIGVAHLLQPQPCLYFMTPDGRRSPLFADHLPAPLHLTRSFLGAHYLSAAEKTRIAWGLLCLQRADPDRDMPFLDWLHRHGQTPRTVERFWGLVLTSALNETPDRIGLRYARKVFVDGFLRHRRGFEVELPTVPLGRLYGGELQPWLQQHGVQVRLQQAVKRIHITDHRVESIELRSGECLGADHYISAVPFDRLLDLLPGEIVEKHACFAKLRRLEASPITSVHLWYRQPILDVPHVVLIDSVGQWVFQRGEVSPGEHYVQVVVSAARQFRGLGHEEVQRRISEELAWLFPAAALSHLIRARVVTEHAATFSAVPGVDTWRPGQETPVKNLFLAGDWTATGWPATMEGAVRSGYLAAEAILRRTGHPESLIQPDLA